MLRHTWALAGGLILVAAGVARAQQPESGGAIYARQCASCHGARGTPNPGMARALHIPDLATATAATLPDSVIREVVTNGKGRTMPAYKAKLTPAQIEAVGDYVRSLGKHEGH